jgi:hypothetical protein
MHHVGEGISRRIEPVIYFNGPIRGKAAYRAG